MRNSPSYLSYTPTQVINGWAFFDSGVSRRARPDDISAAAPLGEEDPQDQSFEAWAYFRVEEALVLFSPLSVPRREFMGLLLRAYRDGDEDLSCVEEVAVLNFEAFVGNRLRLAREALRSHVPEPDGTPVYAVATEADLAAAGLPPPNKA